MQHVETPLAVAVDLGGTHFRVALVGRHGDLHSHGVYDTDAASGPDAILARIADAILQAVAAAPPGSGIVGVGIVAPGPIDPWRGVIYTAPNLPGWDNLPLADRLAAATHLPVRAGNDANLAALGEHRFGAGRGVSHMVFVTVSTGVGGGIIVDDQLLLGARGVAGEPGHMTIDLNGPRCNCGNRGCLEALASGTAIARQATEALTSGRASALGGPGAMPTAAAVAAAAAAGDALATEVVEDAARAMGVGVVNLLHLFDPRMVVLGGGVSRSGELWWQAVRAEVERRAMPIYLQGLQIVPAALGDNAGLCGAAAMVL
ncbi:MAG TPA: ROK family protein [Chloroflexota bacterium]